MAGSMDDNPPQIIGPDDYIAALFLMPGDDAIRYWIMRSGNSDVSKSEIKRRLCLVLAAIELDDDE